MSIFSNINFFRDYEPPSDYKDFLWAGILGFVVGDAAGLPFDGMRREELANLQNKKPELIGYKQHFQPPGTWSDNSALLFATMQSLYDYNLILNPDALMQNYCSWMDSCKFTATGEHINSPASVLESCELYGRGKAATLCGMNHNHTDDCGNFSRVFPLAFLSISEDKMFSAAVMISGLTDAKDQQVLLACLYLAVARRLMLGERDKHWAVQEAIDTLGTKYLLTSLDPVLDSLKDPVKAAQHWEFDGTSASTLIASLAAFTSGKNYEDTVLYAIKLGGNTSMSAALAGGLAGIYYGVQNVPKRWTNVLTNRDWVYKKIANHAIIA